MIKQYHNRWVYCQKFDDESLASSKDWSDVVENSDFESFFKEPVVTCCPDVCKFDTPPIDRSKYFGFDDKTNLADNATYFNYWDIDGNKTIPTEEQLSKSYNLYNHNTGVMKPNRMIRDGSTWVSVATGKTIEIDAETLSASICNNDNVTFKSLNTRVATVRNEQAYPLNVMINKNYKITIQGNSPGETSIVAICNDKVIGWVHVYCDNIVMYNIQFITIINTSTTKNIHSKVINHFFNDPKNRNLLHLYKSPKDIENEFRDMFNQSLIEFNFQQLKVKDITNSTDELNLLFGDSKGNNSNMDSNKNSIIDSNGNIRNLRSSDPNYPQWDKNCNNFMDLVKAKGRGNYKSIIFIQPPRENSKLGKARDIISDSCLIYCRPIINQKDYTSNIVAHEFGHIIGLRHPNDPSPTTNFQYPQHLLNSEGKTFPNVMDLDNENLMGYDFLELKSLRYLQWKIREK